jgi:hypothetical protein
MEDSSVTAPNSDVVAGRAASRRRRARRRGRLLAAAITAAVLGLAACGGGSGGSSNAGGSTSSQSTYSQLVAFSRCVRSHGVLNYPYPNSSGKLPDVTSQQLGVSNSQYQAATQACGHLLPNGGNGPTQADLQQQWDDMANFARCMRSHGVPDWPDPTGRPARPGRPFFNLQPLGIDPNSPQISTKIHECLPLLHGDNPQHLGEGGS